MPDSTSLHESAQDLRPETIDRHRAFLSLMEELEAVDWYDQRVDAAQDDDLRAILAHNRDEEKEHAMMTLEWLRRRDPTLDAHMRTFLFTEGDIVHVAEEDTHGDSESRSSHDSDHDAVGLGIGSLKETQP